MEERNKQKLEELIEKTMAELEKKPNDEQLLTKLDTLVKLSTADYAAAGKVYAEQVKAEAEADKAEQMAAIERDRLEAEKEEAEGKLAMAEAELEQRKKQDKFDRWFKPVKAIASVAIPIAICHADRIGEFVDKLAVTVSTKLFDRD